MTPNPISISTTMASTQAVGLSHLEEKTESIMSSITNASGHRSGAAVSHSTEAKSKNPSSKKHGSEGSDESSSSEELASLSRHQATKNKDKDKKKRKALALRCESSGASSFGKTKTSTSELHKKQKIQESDDSLEEVEDGEHDPTTAEGQMAINPNMTAKVASTEAKREYNRRNAARARKRNKHLVGDLQEKVHKLTRRAEDLERSNDVLQAQLEVLQSQNRDLLVSRKETAPSKTQVQPSNAIMSQLLEQLQGENETQQQAQTMTQLLNSLNGQGNSSQMRSSFQGGQQAGGNIFAGMQQGKGNAHVLNALLGQGQGQNQSQTFRPQQEISNPHAGMQGQSMSQLLSTFGLQGQQQQQRIPQQHVSSASHQDQQQLQQLLTSMPTEVLYNMLHGNNASVTGRR